MHELIFKTVLDLFSLKKGNRSFALSGGATKTITAQEKVFCISNSFLRVIVNTCTGHLDVFNATGSKISLGNIIPFIDQDKPIKLAVICPVFGEGTSLLFNATGGNFIAFTLYKGQPFLFIRQTGGVNNENENFPDTPASVCFDLDLETPIVELDIVAAGARVTSVNNPGCYVLMTIRDCYTRNEVVCGLLTNEKDNALLKSEIINNCIRIQVEAGHFRLSEESAPLDTLVIGCFKNVPVLLKDVLQSDWKSNISIKPGIALLLGASGMVRKIAASAVLH